jgi:hypothetical protein
MRRSSWEDGKYEQRAWNHEIEQILSEIFIELSFSFISGVRLEEKLCIISDTETVNGKGAAEGSHGASTKPLLRAQL